jgi:hypothetical protein
MSFMRYPRTTQERRANGERCGTVLIDGYYIRLRARRSKANLVDSYDDQWRRCQRSWKEQRKTQYKGVVPHVWL